MQNNCDESHDDIIQINNQHNPYIELRLNCEITLMVRPEVFSCCPSIFDCLNSDVSQCLRILPHSVRPLVRRTRIWVNLTYCYGRCAQPEHVNHTTAHHHEGWLLWAKDNVDKTLGIEIYNARDYLRMRHHWNGAGLILHEFCHLIHQHVFGLDCERIKTIYDHALLSRRYDNVLRRDWAGKKEGETDLAYAMIDCKEFFAEMSVTFLANGFRELDCSRNNVMALCSPPITEPTVLERLKAHSAWLHSSSLHESWIEAWIQPWVRFCRGGERHPHCNKFYPFTGGQLHFYDPSLYNEIRSLWSDITEWDDPYNSEETSCSICWIPLKKQESSNRNSNRFVTFLDKGDVHTRRDVEDTVDL